MSRRSARRAAATAAGARDVVGVEEGQVGVGVDGGCGADKMPSDDLIDKITEEMEDHPTSPEKGPQRMDGVVTASSRVDDGTVGGDVTSGGGGGSGGGGREKEAAAAAAAEEMAEPMDEFVVEVADIKEEHHEMGVAAAAAAAAAEAANTKDPAAVASPAEVTQSLLEVDDGQMTGLETEEQNGGSVVQTVTMDPEATTVVMTDEVASVHGGGGAEEDAEEMEQIVIQIMTPDGQIVTTTTRQADLMQTLQMEGAAAAAAGVVMDEGGVDDDGSRHVAMETAAAAAAEGGTLVTTEDGQTFVVQTTEDGGFQVEESSGIVAAATPYHEQGVMTLPVAAAAAGMEGGVPEEAVTVVHGGDVIVEEGGAAAAANVVQSAVVYQCPACPRTFDRHNAFYGHMRSHKGVIFRCDRDPISCHQEFSTLAALRRHQTLVHDTVKEFKCGQCTKSFDKEAELKTHVQRIHEASRPYACKLCPKSFHKRSDLKQHLRLHLGIKRNSCKICGRAFAHLSNLYRHMRTHDGEGGQYACGECGLKFLKLSGLNQHMRTHENNAMASLDENLEEVERELLEESEDVTAAATAAKDATEEPTTTQETILPDQIANDDDDGGAIDENESMRKNVASSVVNKVSTTAASAASCILEKTVEEQDLIEEQEIDSTAAAGGDAVAAAASRRSGSSRRAGKTFMCKMCLETFKSEGVAKAHLRSVHTLGEEKQFLCRKCGVLFKTKEECRAHVQSQHLAAMKKMAAAVSEQQEPARSNSGDSSLQKQLRQLEECLDTPATRKKRAQLKRKAAAAAAAAVASAKQQQAVDPKVMCKVCDKNCRTLSMLGLHIKEHEKRGQMVCKNCRRDCKTTEILYNHACAQKLKKMVNLCDPEALTNYVEEVTGKDLAKNVPSEIVLLVPQDQLAQFTKPETQLLTEKLRSLTTVSLQVKTREELLKVASLEMENEGKEHGSDDSCEDSDSSEEDDGEPTLEEMEEFAKRKIGHISVVTDAAAAAASGAPAAAAAGYDHDMADDEGQLDQYMDYIPKKVDQEARLKAMRERPTIGGAAMAMQARGRRVAGRGGRPARLSNSESAAALTETLAESVVVQTVPLDKPESIIQVQPMMELVEDNNKGGGGGGEDGGSEEKSRREKGEGEDEVEQGQQQQQQFFKVMNMDPEMMGAGMEGVMDSEAMITISTDDGDNWIVTSTTGGSGGGGRTTPAAAADEEASASLHALSSKSRTPAGSPAATLFAPSPVKVGAGRGSRAAVKRSSAILAAPIIINEPVRYPLSSHMQPKPVNPFKDNGRLDKEEKAKLSEFLGKSNTCILSDDINNENDETTNVAAAAVLTEEEGDDDEKEAVPTARAGTGTESEGPAGSFEKLTMESLKGLKKGANGKYECSVCANDFTRAESLFQHMAIHDESLAIKCDLCDQKFAWKSTLRKHRLTVHEGKVLTIPCNQPDCKRTFKSFGHRKIHIARDHLKERNHQCQECGKKFFLKDDLKTHSRIHTGVKPYSCAHCGKTFKHISHRNRHQKTAHTAAAAGGADAGRPYTCELCKKGFVGKQHLITHFRRHHHDLGAHQVDTLLNFMLKTSAASSS